MYSELSDHAMGSNIGTFGSVEKKVCPSKESAIEASRGDVIGMMHREVAEDIGPNPRRTLPDYRRKCEGMMDVGRFSEMEVDGENIVLYIRKTFHRDAALDA